DPLVKPVRLTALKRIAYDKPIRKQLMLSKLVQSNDDHLTLLERIAVEANICEVRVPPIQEENIEPTKPNEQELAKEDTIQDFKPEFKPFLNRIGQLIINPVGRSKEFFIKHNQPLPNSDFL
ncbi:unnamed protein product, partial [Rotaria socialis]